MLKRSVNSKYRNDGIRVRRVLQYVLFADVADKLCARTSRFHSVLFVIISARRNLLFPPPPVLESTGSTLVRTTRSWLVGINRCDSLPRHACEHERTIIIITVRRVYRWPFYKTPCAAPADDVIRRPQWQTRRGGGHSLPKTVRSVI